MTGHIETERKYIIRLPDFSVLEAQPDYTVSDIEQIYLNSDEGVTHRVRVRKYKDKIEYTETRKVRIDRLSAVEEEREISEDEFSRISKNIKEGTRPVIKRRHTFRYFGQLFEIDVYPSWKCTAIMETELDSDRQIVKMPPFIKIIREVTGVKGYSNAAMSRSFPAESVTNDGK